MPGNRVARPYLSGVKTRAGTAESSRIRSMPLFAKPELGFIIGWASFIAGLTFAFLVGQHPGHLRSLVLAARMQHHQNHQVRQRKQPLVRLLPRRLSRARDKADVPGARQIVEMLQADARQAGNLRVREDLMA